MPGYADWRPMKSMLLFDFERLNFDAADKPSDWRFKTTIRVKYP